MSTYANNSCDIKMLFPAVEMQIQFKKDARKNVECFVDTAYAIHPIVLRNSHASAIEWQRCNAQNIWYWQFVLNIRLRYIYNILSANALAITQDRRLHL